MNLCFSLCWSPQSCKAAAAFCRQVQVYSEVELSALVDWAGWCNGHWSPDLHCLSHGKNWVYHLTELGHCVIKWHNFTPHSGRLSWFLECHMCMTLHVCVIIITKIQLFFCKPISTKWSISDLIKFWSR